jgi:hypothetical protein
MLSRIIQRSTPGVPLNIQLSVKQPVTNATNSWSYQLEICQMSYFSTKNSNPNAKYAHCYKANRQMLIASRKRQGRCTDGIVSIIIYMPEVMRRALCYFTTKGQTQRIQSSNGARLNMNGKLSYNGCFHLS